MQLKTNSMEDWKYRHDYNKRFQINHLAFNNSYEVDILLKNKPNQTPTKPYK